MLRFIYLDVIFFSNLFYFSHILLIPTKVLRSTYYTKRFHTFGIIRHLLLRFVNSCISSIILHYCSSLFFPGLLSKCFTVLCKALKPVIRACDEFVKVIINMVVNRQLKSCKLLASIIKY